jgi:hypothetical protein
MGTVVVFVVYAIAAVLALILGVMALVLAMMLVSALANAVLLVIIGLAKLTHETVCLIGRVIAWPFKAIVQRIKRRVTQ